MERDGNICEDDALCAEEEEEVDPRIQVRDVWKSFDETFL